QRLKRQRDIEAKHTLTQEQLIDKLAKGMIDAETFRNQSQSVLQKRKTISSISDIRIKASLQKVIQKSFTLNMLHPYIDEIHITKNKELSGIYLKDEQLNIVNQAVQSSTA